MTADTPPRSRPYAGRTDLRRMQDLAAAAYERTGLRVGDVAWLARHATQRQLVRDIRLWEEGDDLVAWAFYRTNGGFNAFVTPGHGQAELLDELLAFVEEEAAVAAAAGDPPAALYTYGIDLSRSDEDRALAAALERHGFHDTGARGGLLVRSLDGLADPAPPPGYRIEAVSTEALVAGRVEAHRAAFAPSQLTVELYERVRRTWPYRPALDRVAVDGGGEVVAFCTAWLDERNAAGLLEPVGTHPDHQRRGLASAVCLDALRALRAAGATTAEVGYGTEAGLATYRSLGFEPRWADADYRRARA